MPARAALATGQYVHKNRCWDNANPFHGQLPSWHKVIRDAGHDVVSIGKLHFRSTEDDNGFSREILPMHVVNGVGDLKGLLRANPRRKNRAGDLAAEAGVGMSDYFRFDRAVADAAVEWLGERKDAPATKPWVLFVSFVMPHFPLIVPEQYYALYRDIPLAELRAGLDAPVPDHPVLRQMRQTFDYDRHFDDERKATALRAYFGMVTALDDNVGRVLSALSSLGQADDTRVIYASDHGDNLGNRGMWGKSLLYEDSVAIPLIATGDGFPAGSNASPVSLVDLFPTFLDATGVSAPDVAATLDGTSLFHVVQSDDPDRVVFSEYHAVNSVTGHFMIRRGSWKLIYYVGGPPQLFDLSNDPQERHDLAGDPAAAERLRELEEALRAIIDPEAASALALADQAAVVRAHGGEEGVLASLDIPFTPAPVPS